MALFSKEAWDKMSEPVPQRASVFHQFFSHRRSFYQTLRTQIVDPAQYIEYWREIQQWEQKFNQWNGQFQKAQRTNSDVAIVSSLEKANVLFEEAEELVAKLLPYTAPGVLLVNTVEQRLAVLEKSVLAHVDKGIANVLDLKTELKLTGNFETRIKDYAEKLPKRADRFFNAFIALLVLLAAILAVPFFIPDVVAMAWYIQVLLRLSVAAPFLWLIKFVHNHYKMYRIAQLKYEHLNRLLGGGAMLVNQLLPTEEQSKGEVYQRLIKMLMSIDDVTSVISSGRGPETVSVADLTGVVRELRALADSAKKLK